MSLQQIRKLRTTKKITYFSPVVVVSRSNKNIVAQVVDSESKKVVFTANSNKISGQTKTEKSKQVGALVAKWLADNKKTQVVFNRNGLLYHGRVQALADGIREGGITL
jgi:large subunit ribosomal protein L18